MPIPVVNALRKPWIRAALAVLALAMAAGVLLGLAAGAWALGLRLSGNVHAVEPGEAYRSAQLGGPALEQVVREHGIRTVLNLRGEHRGSAWYRDELAATDRAGARHVDIRMSADAMPDAVTMRELLATLSSAPRPILIHCNSGADRTGLAAALYEALVRRRPVGDAAGQLSFRYGHFPWLLSQTDAMDSAFTEELARQPSPP